MEQVLQFKGKWRTYQKRILDSLSLHFFDKRLHVVAAPGAGKTTLGIEIIARLNQPTVVLAPTLTIKNQWKTRIIESFLPENYNEDIISTDIKSPKFITIITYQALLSAFSNSKNARFLARKGIRVHNDITTDPIEYQFMFLYSSIRASGR